MKVLYVKHSEVDCLRPFATNWLKGNETENNRWKGKMEWNEEEEEDGQLERT